MHLANPLCELPRERLDGLMTTGYVGMLVCWYFGLLDPVGDFGRIGRGGSGRGVGYGTGPVHPLGGAHIAPGGGARNGDTPDPPPRMTDLLLGGSDPPPRMTDLLLGGGGEGQNFLCAFGAAKYLDRMTPCCWGPSKSSYTLAHPVL